MLQTLLFICSSLMERKTWLEIIPEGARLIFSLALFFINLLVLTVVLYLAGLAVVGGKRALLSDAFIISFLGTVLSFLFFMFIPYGLISIILSIFVWLLLIKRFYETGWLGAVAVGILAIIVFFVIAIILALTFGILAEIIERFLPFMILIL